MQLNMFVLVVVNFGMKSSCSIQHFIVMNAMLDTWKESKEIRKEAEDGAVSKMSLDYRCDLNGTFDW